ncbi:hypothetical protein DWQ65_11280 [Treponema phagedenis]|nr:hypothetical protein C5O78_07620 [Treponema phagedenis]QSI00629.1 hypothetical protein DWQ65_11280 [Treponema phagedenis]
MVLTRTSKPNRSVELFFIKFFTFWVRCSKKRIDLLKKRYTNLPMCTVIGVLFYNCCVIK